MLKNCDSQSSEETTNVINACDNKTHKVAKVAKKENTNAKNRWKLLARAILTNNKSRDVMMKEILPISNVSQDFSGFDLVQVEQMRKDEAEVFTLKIDVKCNKFECDVHIEKLWTMKDLIGFNNTGNITFWTSEAALTYYCIDNLQMFNDSWVLELGGGMFCLAGLMLAKYSNAFAVHLSDGNQSSLNNVRKSLNLNDTKCFVKSSGIFLSSLIASRITQNPSQFSDGKLHRINARWSDRNTILFCAPIASSSMTHEMLSSTRYISFWLKVEKRL
jgi:hypothetical protein